MSSGNNEIDSPSPTEEEVAEAYRNQISTRQQKGQPSQVGLFAVGIEVDDALGFSKQPER